MHVLPNGYFQYQQEEISFNHIAFTDNTLCLELLEKPPRCILRLLSEQCHLPRGCDASYISNLHGEFENNERYVKGKSTHLISKPVSSWVLMVLQVMTVGDGRLNSVLNTMQAV